METRRAMRWLPWLLLAVFALLAFTWKIGGYPLTDHDETLYSEVGREVSLHSDWWTLHWQGKPWFIHAPLTMWIQSLSFRLFGISEASARLHSVIFALGLVMLTAAFGRMLYGRRVGLIAGLILVSSPIFLVIARMAILDMPFTFFMTLAIFLFVKAWRENDRRMYPFFWLAVGLATLTKGLWGLVFPCMVCFIYAVTGRERRRLLDWRLYASSAVWAVLVLPWVIAETSRYGRDFLGPFLATNTYERLTTSVCNHSGPWWYYVPMILVGLFPWSVLWGTSFFRKRGEHAVLFTAWIVPALILHSIARTKLPNYLMPMMPAFALMLASTISESKRQRVQAGAMVGIGIVIGLAFALSMRNAHGALASVNYVQIAIWSAACYILAGVALMKLGKRGVAVAAVLTAAMLCGYYSTYASISDNMAPKRIAMEARALAGHGTIAVVDGVSCPFGLYFYGRPPFKTATSTGDLVKWLSSYKGDYALLLSEQNVADLSKRGVKLKTFSRRGKWILAKSATM